MPTLQVLTSISQMVPKTKQNINSKHMKMLIENFLSFISRDKNILSPRLLSVTENEVKIQSSFFLILGLSCSLWIYLIAGIYILTSIFIFNMHLCDTVPSTLIMDLQTIWVSRAEEPCSVKDKMLRPYFLVKLTWFSRGFSRSLMLGNEWMKSEKSTYSVMDQFPHL